MSSSGIPQGTVPVTDEIYSVAEGAVQIDASTARRDMQVTPPTTPAIAPYNTGKTLKFNVSGGTDRIRLDTTALRMSFGFYGANTGVACNADATAPIFSVPWNLWATCISAISLKINGNTVIYESSGGEYVHGLSARMFREYTAETLNGMDDVFFTPVTGDERYVAGTLAGGIDFPSAAKERAARWIGANSHEKVVTKIIPFSVLFPPAICAVLKNLQSYELSITFINYTQGHWVAHGECLDAAVQIGLLEQKTLGATAAGVTQALVYVNNCDIIQDRYTPSAMLTVQQTAQKMPGEGSSGSDVERLAYYDVAIIDHTYQSSGTIQVGSTSNLDAVCIMQPCVFGYAKTPTWRGNGKVAGERAVLTSSGQYIFGNSCVAANDQTKTQADDTAADGFMTVQLQYGTLTYPSLPIEIRGAASAVDFALLHQAYLRGVAKSTRKDVTPAIKFADFRRCLPFCFLRLWSDAAPHLNNSATDLTIRLPGGHANTSSIFIVLFQVGMTDLRSDGSIYRFKSVS